MSVLDRFFEGFTRKAKAIEAFEKDASEPLDTESEGTGNSSESFLDPVGDLAIRQQN